METLFKLINAFPMPVWLAMMFPPNHPLTERASAAVATSPSPAPRSTSLIPRIMYAITPFDEPPLERLVEKRRPRRS